MGDYTNMSGYYDLIMTSGYYDYSKIVNALLAVPHFRSVLEMGCGTGLILEELAHRKKDIAITGFDLTEAMLDIAKQRLSVFPEVRLVQQNVTELDLHQQYDVAFSYGGVWYFVMDGENEPFLVSHIYNHEANLNGWERAAEHIASGGQLLLGVQGPHSNYASPIRNGYVYSQTITPLPHGFHKEYFLDDGHKRLMEQRIDYRTYPFDEACELLANFGLIHQPSASANPQFVRFVKS
jgi:SAM-dependent methyltransferase